MYVDVNIYVRDVSVHVCVVREGEHVCTYAYACAVRMRSHMLHKLALRAHFTNYFFLQDWRRIYLMSVAHDCVELFLLQVPYSNVSLAAACGQ